MVSTCKTTREMCIIYCYLGTSESKAEDMGEGPVPGRPHRVLLGYISLLNLEENRF